MLTTTQSTVTYLGNGATTQFAYNFLVPAQSQMVVTLTNNNVSPAVVTTLSTSQYSVSGIGNATGGIVTYTVSGSPLASGWSITIQRVVPYQQNTSLTNQGAFYPQVVEAALDYLTMQCQQLAAQIAGLSSTETTETMVQAGSTVLLDTSNGHTYQLVCTNGILGLEEIS
ncbi:MAG: hypothetical protein ABSF52_09360 [Syntrophobacteraceae bacterium]